MVTTRWLLTNNTTSLILSKFIRTIKMTIILTIMARIRTKGYKTVFLLIRAPTQAMETVEAFQLSKMLRMVGILPCMSICSQEWMGWIWELEAFHKWIMVVTSRNLSIQARRFLFLRAWCKGELGLQLAISSSLIQTPFRTNKREGPSITLALREMRFKTVAEAEIRSEESKMKHKR